MTDSQSGKRFEELHGLAHAHLRGEATDEQVARLESLVTSGAEACELYLKIID